MASLTSFARGALLIASVAGCAPVVPRAALELPPTSLAERQVQTRRFATSEEGNIQRAAAQVLQDLGFQIDDSETRLGVIVASKARTARGMVQISAAGLASYVFSVHLPTEPLQTIRASLATRPVGSSVIAVRITFQRLAWDGDNTLAIVEAVSDPALYQEFFDRLSQSVFLTGQGL
jgi:hypothetical protein